jgi:hypothetical protein
VEPNFAPIEAVYRALQASHEAFHRMEAPTPDSPTAVFAMTERDLLLIGMALPAMEVLFLQSGISCFYEASADLQRRVMEVVRVQRPEWTLDAREES